MNKLDILAMFENIDSFSMFVDKMKEDPTLIFIVGISVSITLMILLIVLVSTLTIKNLKNNLFRLKDINEHKVKEITKLTREVKIVDNKNKEINIRLKNFKALEEELDNEQTKTSNLKNDIYRLERDKKHIEEKLIKITKEYQSTKTEIKGIKKRNEELIDERRKK